MTSTLTQPGRNATDAAPPRGRAGAVRRTLMALAACILGTLPLTRLVDGYSWLIDVWLAMGIVLLPALLLRLRRAPGALQIWPGVLLLALWLTARFVPTHAIAGVIPGPGAWHDVNAVLNELHATLHYQTAPVASSVAVRLALSLLMALVTALVDLLAVVGRHAALAGLPLLAVLTICGAVTRTPVPWPMFILAAVGYLLLLAMDSPDDLAGWGHRLDRGTTASRSRSALAASGPWVAASAVVLALVAAALVPSRAHNALTDALHSAGGSGQGKGGTGTSIDPWAGLRGELTHTTPIDLATVTVRNTDPSVTVQPFYLRTAVLSTFVENGWVGSLGDQSQPLGDSAFQVLPPDPDRDANNLGVPDLSFTANVKVAHLTGTPPVFAVPTTVSGLNNVADWDPLSQTLTGGTVSSGLTYSMRVSQPVPTQPQLEAVPWSNDADPAWSQRIGPWLQLPAIPQQVRTLLSQILAVSGPLGGSHATTGPGPYQTARKINDFFTDPANNFEYTLSVPNGDSGNALVDFLTNRKGFCQQYAAAEAVLFRMAGVPARVVLGYTHPVPNSSGRFMITSDNAHAWVEAYFVGLGWVPFDPTPLVGIAGGAANDLPYAPHATPPTVLPSGSSATVGKEPIPHRVVGATGNTGTKTSAGSTSSTHLGGWLAAIAVLVVVGGSLGAPRAVRLTRTRRRIAAARHLGPEPLWDELADTAQDLGYVWSAARSPRQVADWLGRPAHEAAVSLTALARSVELARYAPASTGQGATAAAVRELRDVQGALRAGLTAKQRFWTRWAPRSVIGRRRR